MSVKPSVVVFLVAVIVLVFVVLIIRPVKEQIFVTTICFVCFSMFVVVAVVCLADVVVCVSVQHRKMIERQMVQREEPRPLSRPLLLSLPSLSFLLSLLSFMSWLCRCLVDAVACVLILHGSMGNLC